VGSKFFLAQRRNRGKEQKACGKKKGTNEWEKKALQQQPRINQAKVRKGSPKKFLKEGVDEEESERRWVVGLGKHKNAKTPIWTGEDGKRISEKKTPTKERSPPWGKHNAEKWRKIPCVSEKTLEKRFVRNCERQSKAYQKEERTL